MSTESLPVHQTEEAAQPLSEAGRLNHWIFEMIHPYLKGSILEIGSGEGDFAKVLLANNISLRLSDPHGKYCRILQETFDGNPGVKGIHRINPLSERFETSYASYFDKFNTLFLVNQIEVPGDDRTLLKNLTNLVKEDGHLILVFPIHMALYNDSEEGVEYWRHNNRLALKKMFGSSFGIVGARFFNIEKFPGNPVRFIPSFKITEGTGHRFGLSVVVMAMKNK